MIRPATTHTFRKVVSQKTGNCEAGACLLFTPPINMIGNSPVLPIGIPGLHPMNYRQTAYMASVIALHFGSLTYAAIEPSSSDLWDVSKGTIVTAGSPALNWNAFYRSDLSNMFGGVLNGTCCGDQAIFGDQPQG